MDCLKYFCKSTITKNTEFILFPHAHPRRLNISEDLFLSLIYAFKASLRTR